MTRNLCVLSLCLPLLVVGGPALAANGQDFPCLRGPAGTGEMADWAGGLINDPSKAKVLWTSEERNFGVGWGYGVGPENKNRSVVRSCGFSGPVAVGRRVFFIYYLPGGDIVDEKILADGKDKRRESWAVDADDVLVCMDAESGKTLWKSVFAGQGLNWNLHRKVPWTCACVVGERVYWAGCAGKVYCVNAADGKTCWESDTGDGRREFEKMRAAMRAAKSVETAKRSRIQDGDSTAPCNSTPCFADNVILLNDSLCDKGSAALREMGNGLVGLDAQTGKFLWRVPDAAGAYVSPVPWKSEGKELVIGVAPRRVLCLAPKTGQVLWELKERMDGRVTPAVSGEYLLAQRSQIRGSVKEIAPDEKGLTCYRLTAEGPKKLWELEPGDFSGPFSPPVIAGKHGYALCKSGLVCVELETGRIAGKVEKVGDGHIPLMAANGRLFAAMDVLSLDPANFKALGKIKVSHETFTPVTVSEGRLYVRGRLPEYADRNRAGKEPPEPGCVYCVDLRK